jgi:adenosylcobinamide amidohydrolase
MTWKMKMTEGIKLPMGYNGYKLTDNARKELLAAVPAMFPDVVAHHVTHEFNIAESDPPYVGTVRVVAVASNDMIQAVLVKVLGTVTRAHGDSFYHVTLSMDKNAGAKANDSNALIKDSGDWIAVVPFDIDVIPTFFPFGK